MAATRALAEGARLMRRLPWPIWFAVACVLSGLLAAEALRRRREAR